MLPALRALVAALALGPLAVHGLFQHISFSPIGQCGAFNVSFDGGIAPDALPLQLTIVPFNASPIAIALPDDAWNATSAIGAAVTFLPLAAGTTFLASLDDANGNPTGVNTSDIIQVQPSDDASCLAAAPQAQTPVYSVSSIRQCELFNASFDVSIVTNAPTARAFIPLAPSFTLDMKAFTTGMASYLMNVTRGTQLAIVFNDGAGHNQSSVPLTVFGDTSSSSQCLNIDSGASASPQPLGGATNTTGGLPRLTVIIIAACTVVVVGTLSLLSIIFVVRERQRRRTMRLRNAFFPRGDPEKINPYIEPTPVAPTPAYLPYPRETRLLTGRPYGVVSPRSETFGRMSSVPLTPKTPKSSISEKSGFTETPYPLPSPPPPPVLPRPTPRKRLGRQSSFASVNAQTIASLDIEQILEQATVSPGPTSAFNTPRLPSSAGHAPPSPQPNASPVQAVSPLPSALRISPISSKRDAQELDVPSSATPSGRFSDYSHIQEASPMSRYRVAPFLDPPPFSAGSRRRQSPPPVTEPHAR